MLPMYDNGLGTERQRSRYIKDLSGPGLRLKDYFVNFIFNSDRYKHKNCMAP